jgi:CDP-diacylglycerol--glycerol-3-phosphate 3-phosphatidyltransferase
MNLPNKLTLLRIIMIPFFVVCMLLKPDSFSMRIAADIIFIAASFTDMLDGKIARKYNLITDFGKFMDPLADKLLVCSALICLLSVGQLSAWVVIVIISREFIISGFRLIASDNGIVIAASYWGKAKTVSQMLMIIYLIFTGTIKDNSGAYIFGQVMIYVSVVLTVVSLIDYLWKNRGVLKEQK